MSKGANVAFQLWASWGGTICTGFRGVLARRLRRLAQRLDGGTAFVVRVEGDISPEGLQDIARKLPDHMCRDLHSTMELEVNDRLEGIEASTSWRSS